MQNLVNNDQIPLSVDINYLRKLEKENETLREENRKLNLRIEDAYNKAYKLNKELENFQLFLSYLVNTHGMVNGHRLFKFPDMFWGEDKLTTKIMSEHIRYTINKGFDGLVLVDRYDRLTVNS